MVQIDITYTGEKHCSLTHGPSGTVIQTDAPKDNQGKGESFSPTDLVAAALGSCILTTVAVLAEKEGWTLGNARATVEKNMSPPPRRIESLSVVIQIEGPLSPQQQTKVKEWALTCPVHRSLHPEVRLPISIQFV